MLLVCPQCSARLQLDDAKAPARPFSVRCPKCQASVSHSPATTMEVSAAAEVPSPADGEPSSRFEAPTAAPRFKPREEQATVVAEEATGGMAEIARLLAAALDPSQRDQTGRKRPKWDRRKVLVCSSPAYREAIAESLASQEYDVFVAANMAEGLGRMREEHMDVVVLDANFDPVEQGVAFITREVRLLRPAERRRLFLVYLTSNVRTMDLHNAFLQNANLVVNPSDIEQLPEALEVSIRHYNDLYKPFNRALDVAPI
ncbi:MAG TPA: zinc-ribbon domain-containing protein [Pyrinomonadaceae bacterium]|nr:zinc-ribbon domain-containing protein [Pyrinomonadaceae bacterium]